MNELRWATALFGGGTVAPGSGGPTYEGVAAVAWGDPAYWRPEHGADAYKARWGFPTYESLLDAARRPFQAEGSRCRGWPVAATTMDWCRERRCRPRRSIVS